MSFRIEQSFELQAPVDRAWSYLVDPRQVVNCLPGAELLEVKDDQTFLGRVKVKVGPVTAAYDGRVTITGRDDATHVVSMVGEGRERAGSGSAKMTMTSRLTPVSAGVTQVQITADVDIVGKAAQFGRGMIESVNKQLFKQFTECLRSTLESPTADAMSVMTGTAAGPAAASPVATGLSAPSARSSVGGRPLRLLPLLWHAFVDWLRRVTSGLRHRPAR